MRIDGIDITGRARGKVRIPRPGGGFELEVEAYPWGFDISEKLPNPEPPVTSVRTRKGEVLRENGAPLLVRDETDAKYRAEKDRIFWLRMAAMFYHAVQPCGKVHFDADAAQLKSHPEAFYAAVASELKAAGFSLGDVNLVVDHTQALSNMSDKRIEEFEADFSQAGSDPSESSAASAADSTSCSESVSGSA